MKCVWNVGAGTESWETLHFWVGEGLSDWRDSGTVTHPYVHSFRSRLEHLPSARHCAESATRNKPDKVSAHVKFIQY